MSELDQRITVTVDGLKAEDLVEKVLKLELSLEDVYGEDEGDDEPEQGPGPSPHVHAFVGFPRQGGKTLHQFLEEAIKNGPRYPGRGGW